jgi:hypothetical protein
MTIGIFENIKNEIYAVGDIHGDYNILIHILVDLAKVCTLNENKLQWIPKNNSWIVFCGDLVDRMRYFGDEPSKVVDSENSDILILNTLMNLNESSSIHGGKVVILVGNHELLNFHHKFKYVPEEHVTEERMKAFTPGSQFAKRLAEHCYVSARINNYVFAHGGFCPEAFENEVFQTGDVITKLNKAFRNFLKYTEDKLAESIPDEDKIIIKILTDGIYGVNSNASPLNCRSFGNTEPDRCVETLNTKIFKYLFPKEVTNPIMIIAHTPQFMEGLNINSICSGHIWRLDVGMSRAFDGHIDYIESLISKTGLCFMNRIEKLVLNDKFRYVAILKLHNGKEQIVTKQKSSKELIIDKNSEAALLTYNLNKLKERIKSGKVKIPRKDELQLILKKIDEIINNL